MNCGRLLNGPYAAYWCLFVARNRGGEVVRARWSNRKHGGAFPDNDGGLADHEEEILDHHETLDWNNAGVAKAYTLVANPIHELDDNGHIVHPVHVPHMIAYMTGELTTLTTAERGATAQLTDAAAWVPKQMRRLFKQIGS